MIQLENSSQEAGIFQNFNLLVESQSGVDQLTDLIFSLAINGKLTKRVSSNTKLTFDLKKLRLEEDRLWGHQFLEECPQSWARLPLAKLGSWGSGGTPSRGNKEYFGGDIPWLIIGDLNDGIVTRASNSITQKGLQESSATKVPIGAVLIAMYGSIGKSGIAGIECATNQAIAHCIPDSEIITSKFLFYLIRATRPKLFAQGRGLAQQNISQTILKHLVVAVPPLEEQALIVSKIEELMQYCDQLKVAIHSRDQVGASARKSVVNAISTAQTLEEFTIASERIQQNWELIAGTTQAISDLRKLIETLGIRGQLTEKLDSKETAEDLLRDLGMNEGVFTTDGTDIVPKNWAITNLGSIIQLEYGKSLPKQSRSSQGDVPVYGSNGIVGYHNEALIDSGVIVVGRKGSIGQVNIAGGKSWVIDTAYYVIPRASMSIEYVALLIKTCNLESLNKATAIPGLNRNDAYAQRCLLAPAEEQKRIINTVNALLDICNRLESALQECDNLALKFSRSVVSASA